MERSEIRDLLRRQHRPAMRSAPAGYRPPDMQPTRLRGDGFRMIIVVNDN
jgi:hypothetical protein